MTDNVILFSGGIDSTTLLYKSINEAENVRALYLDFGKNVSNREKAAIKRICLEIGVPFEIVDISGITEMINGYISVEEYARDELDVKGYEPEARNITGFHMVVSIGSHYSQLVNSNSISLGVIKEQIDHKPTITQALENQQRVISLLNPEQGDFNIFTPLSNLNKIEVIEMGYKYKVPFDLTWSCVYGNEKHCGACIQCKSRKKSFCEVSIEGDPTSYMV